MKLFDEDFQITQFFGQRPEYYSPYGFNGHEGLDLIPKSGKGDNVKVYAIEEGKVVRDTDDPLGDPPNKNYGVKVVVFNRNTKRGWWYCHLENNAVSIGQEIKEDELLGTMGQSGKTSGKHVHLAVRETDDNGNAINTNNGYKGFVDPLPFLDVQIVPPNEQEPLKACLEQHTQLVDKLNAIDAFRKAMSKALIGSDDADSQRILDEVNLAIKERDDNLIQANMGDRLWDALAKETGLEVVKYTLEGEEALLNELQQLKLIVPEGFRLIKQEEYQKLLDKRTLGKYRIAELIKEIFSRFKK